MMATALDDPTFVQRLQEVPFERLVELRLHDFIDTVAQAPEPAREEVHARIVAQVDRALIRLALEQTGHNRIRAAELLGLARNTLRARMRELGLDATAPGRRRGT